MATTFKSRVAKLEKAAGLDAVRFRMKDGSVERIPRRQLLDAMAEVIADRPTQRARTLLNALRASDRSELHTVAQAIYDGPAEAAEVALEEILSTMSDGELDRCVSLMKDTLHHEESNDAHTT